MRRSVVAALLLAAAALGAQDAGLAAGISSLEAGDYPAAIRALDGVVADPGQSAFHADAYLLLAKAQIAVGDLRKATAALEYYLLNFPKHRSYAEGVYLKGRLLYLQGDYESAIVALQRFLKSYPGTLFEPNATYYIGESLFALGRLDEALAPLRELATRWPDSAKAEAAGYRVSLIELHKREAELLNLLKASHEETLRAVEDSRNQERTYEQAITAYQRRLASEGSDSEKDVVALEQQLAARDRELQGLRAQVDALTKQLGQAGTAAPTGGVAPASAASSETIARLLKAKEQALDLKARLIRRLGGEGR